MKIIITGSKGFLGVHLCKELIKNHKIFEYDIIDGFDILNISQLDQIFNKFKPDSIIHLAACANLNFFKENCDKNNMINIIGTRNILNICQKYHTRLLFASTCCCYGNNNIHPSNESSPIAPTEPYAQSKKESEIEILKVGLPHCCMRFATFYGPEMRKELAPAIFIDKAHKNKNIEIHGNGEQTRTMTYVDDIVSGIIIILENKPIHTIINITTENSISVNKMVNICKKVVNSNSNIINIQDRKGQIYKEEIESKILQSYGWKCKTTFLEGIKKSYDYYIKNGYKW